MINLTEVDSNNNWFYDLGFNTHDDDIIKLRIAKKNEDLYNKLRLDRDKLTLVEDIKINKK